MTEEPKSDTERLAQVHRDLEMLNKLIGEVITRARVPRADEFMVQDERAASLRFGLEKMVDDLNQVRQRSESQSRINMYRAEMWRTAADKILSDEDLIQKLLVATGESLQVSRASYVVADNGSYRCVQEWCAPGVKSSLGTSLPAVVVRHMLKEEFNILSADTLSEYLPQIVMKPFKALLDKLIRTMNIESMVLIPIHIGEMVVGAVSLDICVDNPHKHAWTDERRRVAMELVQIITQTMHQRRMEKAILASRDELEVRVRERTAALEKANRKMAEHLQEKEVLLKEIHHRVKNNLQTVSSLLSLQARQNKIPGTEGMFRDSQTRIKTIALLHEKLYRSTDLAHIDFFPYVERIVNDLYYMYADTAGQVERRVEINDVLVGVDKAIPCGLIINELVSNAFKYAFPEDRTGMVRVGMERDGAGRYRLEIADTGVGLPEDIESSGGLGMELVRTLTKQLEGEMEITRNDGTIFTIRFPA